METNAAPDPVKDRMEEPREAVETFERHEAQQPEKLAGIKLSFRRLLWFVGIAAMLVCLVLLPPLLNVNRYAHGIALSIGTSLGRPVHLDSVTLNVLPFPGFTLSNFVVAEDPAFGSEPVIHANSVRATLRVRSLWRKKVEFSRISLSESSVNVVHLPDGRWNLQSILLQASRMPAAPTAQENVGETQRFPYIEATGARVNLKLGGEKTPYSLVDADFALWLPEPEHWRVRLEAHPARTDTAVSDTGLVRVEATLGRAAALAQVPVDLEAEWSAVPLGSLSLIALKRDAGMRGQMTLKATVRGVVGDNTADSHLQITGLRRADFVPVEAEQIELSCAAHAVNVFSSLDQVHCLLPVPPAGGSRRDQGMMLLEGSVSDTRNPETSEWAVTIDQVPASALVTAWRMASDRVPPDLSMRGVANGTLLRAHQAVSGTLVLSAAALDRGEATLFKGDVKVHLQDGTASLDPIALDLGAEKPAVLTGSMTRSGSALQLRGVVTRPSLLAFASAVPPFGDGLGEVLPPQAGESSVKISAFRAWGASQTWTEDAPGQARGRRPR